MQHFVFLWFVTTSPTASCCVTDKSHNMSCFCYVLFKGFNFEAVQNTFTNLKRLVPKRNTFDC